MEQEQTPMDKTIKKLTDFMKATGFSQNRVANGSGISSATLSGWIKGTYPGDTDSITEKVEDYLRVEISRQALVNGKAPVKTRCFVTATKFLEMVQTHRVMGVFTGDAGVGKTTVLKSFVGYHSSVIFIEADHGYTASVLFRELCSSLNLDPRGTLHDLLNRVVNKLEDSGRMIIIDEAEHLPYRALELIRRVYDKAGVGIALVGMSRLERNIKGDPTHYAQLNSRVSLPCRAQNLSDADVKLIMDSAFNTNTDKDMVTLCAKLCHRNARLLETIIRWSGVLMSKYKETTLNSDIITSASDMLSVAA